MHWTREEYAVQRWMYWKMKKIGTLSGAEKPLFDNLSARDNVILTPHIGIFHESYYLMSRVMLENWGIGLDL